MKWKWELKVSHLCNTIHSQSRQSVIFLTDQTREGEKENEDEDEDSGLLYFFLLLSVSGTRVQVSCIYVLKYYICMPEKWNERFYSKQTHIQRISHHFDIIRNKEIPAVRFVYELEQEMNMRERGEYIHAYVCVCVVSTRAVNRVTTKIGQQ